MNNITADTLADTFDSVRNLTKYFFSELEDKHYKTDHKIDDTEINNAYWLLAHLAWTEHSLIIKGVGNEDMEIDWLDDFSYGSDPKDLKSDPSLEEIRDKFDKIHTRSMEIIRGLSETQIQEDNHLGFTLGGSKSKKALIMHAVRHEPMHVGQLSLIIKATGAKSS